MNLPPHQRLAHALWEQGHPLQARGWRRLGGCVNAVALGFWQLGLERRYGRRQADIVRGWQQ
jgi:hypothetical protein